MASVYIYSANSSTLSALVTCFTNLGYTVTSASAFSAVVDYLQYDLVVAAHYSNIDIQNIKSLVVDRGIPLIFSSQANAAGDILTAAGSLAVYLGLATKEGTYTNLSTYIKNDYDALLTSASISAPYTAGSNTNHSSYLNNLAASMNVMGYTSSSDVTNVMAAIFRAGSMNNAGVALNANIGFIGNIGNTWSSTTSWQAFIGAVATYLRNKTLNYYVSGNVVDSANNPIVRTVAIYDRTTLKLVGTATSTGGTFSIKVDHVATKKYFAVCLDDSAGSKASLIKDKVLPKVG